MLSRSRLWILALVLFALPSAAFAQARVEGRITSDTCPGSGCVVMTVTNQGSAAIQIIGTFTATLVFEGSVDGNAFVSMGTMELDNAAGAASTTDAGIWSASVVGLSQIRVRASSYTSGEPLVLMQYTPAGAGIFGVVNLNGVGVTNSRLNANVWIQNGSQLTDRNNAITEGCVQADADASACFPLLIGGWASTAVPTAVSADTDAVKAWFSRNGVLHVMSTAGTATKTNINDAATSQTLFSANTARLHAQCWNNSTSILYVNFTDAASTTANVEVVQPSGMWYLDPMVKFTGAITGIWSADASGAARCTELTQ